MNESRDKLLQIERTKSNRADLRKAHTKKLMADGHSRAVALRMAKLRIR